jgi:diketogulonate reductase-like aldo/keto reductase
MNLPTKSGRPVHPIGIGTWGYGEHPALSPGTEAEIAAIKYSISLGQNYIDTAEMYADGGAERVVGRAIKSASREDLFVASKLWKNHVANGTVRPAVEAILKRLGTSYLDLLSIHAPWFDAPWQEAIPQIGTLIDEGIVRHFGVSNFNSDRLREILAMAHPPIASNQMHYSFMHPHEVTSELWELCSSNNIAIIAYMPLGKGEFVHYPILNDIAKRYRAAPAQIALAWLLDKQALAIPKAMQPSHIQQNIAAASVHLLAEDVLRINNSLTTRRAQD